MAKTPKARAAEMLRIAAIIIREHCPEAMHFYDEVPCDGTCIADDCDSAAEGLEEEVR
jgi:hypothetical protein